MRYSVGIDVGGTFTDLFLHDSESGRFWIGKTPSTPQDQSIGVLEGVRQICETAGIDSAAIEQILHGTTVATNAVLESKGSRVGLVITEGWSQLLHLAESWTPGPLFGFFTYVKPEPLVDYEDIREAPERMDAKGEVIRGLDEDAARIAVRELRDAGVEALTVCLLNSYANPAHELRLKTIAEEELSGTAVPVSISSEITPEFREYERVTTTVMNSYVGPILQRYLGNLEARLREGGVDAPVQVVRSDGGLQSVQAAREHPVQTVLSGPSGGVNGAAFVAHTAGFDRILTFDMGGTSTDVAHFDGAYERAFDTEVAGVVKDWLLIGLSVLIYASAVNRLFEIDPRTNGLTPNGQGLFNGSPGKPQITPDGTKVLIPILNPGLAQSSLTVIDLTAGVRVGLTLALQGVLLDRVRAIEDAAHAKLGL